MRYNQDIRTNNAKSCFDTTRTNQSHQKHQLRPEIVYIHPIKQKAENTTPSLIQQYHKKYSEKCLDTMQILSIFSSRCEAHNLFESAS